MASQRPKTRNGWGCGHLRLLEFLDALLSQGEVRLPAAPQRLRQALAAARLELAGPAAGLEERLRQTVALGLRDVLLAQEVEATAVGPALERLGALSLVVRDANGQAWVNRWTAEGPAEQSGPSELAERRRRAGDYRLWWIQKDTHALATASRPCTMTCKVGSSTRRRPWPIGT